MERGFPRIQRAPSADFISDSMVVPARLHSPSELEAFLAEMDPDIRAADRDLREIDLLEKKEVTGAGKLPVYEELQPRLDALVKAHEEDMQMATELESRIARLMERYATNVSTAHSSLRATRTELP